MFATREIEGHEVNLTLSKDGTKVRAACVMVGPNDRPGWRAKDGAEARRLRHKAKTAVMEALDLPANRVSVSARYSCLTVADDGTIERRDATGHVIGVHLP
jgi:hypothetical protein